MLLFAWHARAGTVYVSLTGTHQFPFNSPATAATNIQAALDMAKAGDQVQVAAGTYRGVGGDAYGANVACVDKAVLLNSSAGPTQTIIDGQGRLRCLYVGHGGVAMGFTLRNGAPSFTGDYLNRSGGGALVADDGTISNCTAQACRAEYGGGFAVAADGFLNDCVAQNCTSEWEGGGLIAVEGAEVDGIVAENNVALWGGGVTVADSDVDRARVQNNLATYGAGADVDMGGELRNSVLVGNTATRFGGGALTESRSAILRNCTCTGNNASDAQQWYDYGNASLLNSIVVANGADLQKTYVASADAVVEYSCIQPLHSGDGNISDDPAFAPDYSLSQLSPCVNVGDNLLAFGARDANANPRIIAGTVDMGALERTSTALIPTENLAKLRTDFKINWAKPDADQLKFSLDFTTPNTTGKFTTVDKCLVRVGDITVDTSTLGPPKINGKETSATYKSAKGIKPVVTLTSKITKKGTYGKVTAVLTKGSIRDGLSPYGVSNTTTATTGVPIKLPGKASVADWQTPALDLAVVYKSKQGKTATGKSVK